MAESKEELKGLLMKVKEESEIFNSQNTKILASSLITSRQIDGEKVETERFYFLGSKTTADGDCNQENKDTCSLEGKLCQTYDKHLYSLSCVSF